MKSYLLGLSFVVAFSASVAERCEAAIVINIATSSTGANFSIAGSGTIADGQTGNIDFDDFGDVFDSLVVSDTPLTFSTPIVIEILRPGTGATFSRSYSQIFFDEQAVSDDLILLADATNEFQDGDLYSVNGNVTLSGDFSGLAQGTFISTTNDSAATRFGTTTLNVTAVPEPSTLAILGMLGTGSVAFQRRRSNR
ncbi:MAG: PEP-CTERM sorting domain-containing protein [Rhodopirellula sp.]|jgi:hypothetical protein|uniref:PEP-CTERM sorting domain-containing protein n=1 Tax=Rhodopirellula europaea TaxID=1263866 RepID=UPI0003451D5D|nr:PEP-CTERM sorting domain-containing protein [Rhodopirellula europaea]MAP09733.1 PEP-CTERM sorting domain-containing protein [Rhodopirellula sp.]MCR9211079.1 PEP-CTERM sorting domain-containing protein [bacterium]|tara:strand:+ start:501 stop:1088 length:588 start_codon:yes stop_codon:yes gene_type:complete